MDAMLNLPGRFVVSSADGREFLPLQSRIDALVAEGKVRIGANLRHVSALDAGGLGRLVAIHQRLRAAGGGLTLLAPSPRLRKLLAVTGLDTVLRISDAAPTSPAGEPLSRNFFGARFAPEL
jgi:anti-anti-sigma factor